MEEEVEGGSEKKFGLQFFFFFFLECRGGVPERFELKGSAAVD